MLTREAARDALKRLQDTHRSTAHFDPALGDMISLLEYAIESPEVIEVDVAMAARHDCIGYALRAYELSQPAPDHPITVAIQVVNAAKKFEEYILAKEG